MNSNVLFRSNKILKDCGGALVAFLCILIHDVLDKKILSRMSFKVSLKSKHKI